MNIEEKVIARLHFKKSFGKDFDCRCRICGTEAEIFTVDSGVERYCDMVIRCPKCKKKNERKI